MKGIILSGGSGTRLYPLTTMVNKQLLPVYDKPMVYYPLTTLINSGIKEVLLITSPQYIDIYQNLLGNGIKWGLDIKYTVQENPKGLAQALTLGKEFLAEEPCCLILGDNIFHGNIQTPEKHKYLHPVGASIFGYEVNDPRSYGVVEFDRMGSVVSLEEKPSQPRSKFAVPGLYYFDSMASDFANTLKPSARGELEIVDLLKMYMQEGTLTAKVMERGTAWLDAGTPSTLFQASAYIQAVQERQGIMVGCYEEACLRNNFISLEEFRKSVQTLPQSHYRSYLERLI